MSNIHRHPTICSVFLNPSWLIPSPQPTAVVSWGTTTWVTSGNAAHLQARNSTCVRRFRSNSQPKQHFKQAKDNARGIVFSKNARWEQKECNIQSEVPKIAQSCSILDAPLLFTSCMLQVPLCRCTTIAVINHLDPPLKPTAPLHLIFCHATISQSQRRHVRFQSSCEHINRRKIKWKWRFTAWNHHSGWDHLDFWQNCMGRVDCD